MRNDISTRDFHITYPEELPVSSRREEIAALIRQHQVVIVCGETGSGKTTQLPKILLELGFGGPGLAGKAAGAKPAAPKLIGHTQPRRIAASSVAKRIAEELKTPLGEVVGYKVRFQDRLSKGALVKLMTDGILLAETQTDPLLKNYDAIIIDEAHERSLNIDFLLGYLCQLLPKRPDLKVIVTSATIDAERFAKHFAGAKGEAAPVITVSGRLYPVEQRYRPFEESKEYGVNEAIADAVDELWREPSQQGDILVFLPGERDIREAAEHLRGHLSHQPLTRGAEVLPLFSRLSQAEQDRIFESHQGRRIVLATNVAETSLTVPGIRYVIDVGTARLKRYSYRNKVEQLQIEAISQAAAQQRAGRCGRVANGVCIRLYSEPEFLARPAFTDPEILRSSLAAVILRMKSLHLGEVESFPFIEPPLGRAIADGYQLLQELAAVDENNELSRLGKQLARLPLDPRIGRMIIEAEQRGALDEVLIIASALSIQDPRDRPLEWQEKADQAHAKFDDEKSEFVSFLTLWKWLHEVRGVKPDGHKDAQGGHKLSNRQYEQKLRENFINMKRFREWRETHSQLLSVAADQGWRLNSKPASYEQLHLSLLAGLLGNVGMKREDSIEYQGARGIKFFVHPGAHLKKKPGRFIVAAELVQTTRLYARGIAHIEPEWLEQVGSHVLKKQSLDPHWEKHAAKVVALERATLYGVQIYHNRKTDFARIDPHAARDIFIREALLAGDWQTHWPFLAHNQNLLQQVQNLEHKQRRQDVLVDDSLIYAFYEAQVPEQVVGGISFDSWYKEASKENKKLLYLSKDELMRHEAAGITTEAFPKVIKLGGVDCAAHYLHAPGDAKDGLSVDIPVFVLNQVGDERVDWLVPGMLKEKILALLKSLPQRPRSRLVPLPHSAEKLAASLDFADGELLQKLCQAVRAEIGLEIQRSDFKLDTLSPHLLMHFRVLGEGSRQLGSGRNLAKLKAELGAQARGAFAALAQVKTKAVAAVSESQAQPSPPSHMPSEVANPSANHTARNTARSPANTTANKATNHHTPHLASPAQGNDAANNADKVYTDWSFGELPELMEIQNGAHSIVGFPALVATGKGTAGEGVRIEVFDQPESALALHRVGLRHLISLQIKDALKYLEKNIPDMQKMAMQYMPLGSLEDLREQIINVALDRAFLAEPLPTNQAAFAERLQAGRGRLTLISSEIARVCAVILTQYQAAQRKIKDCKGFDAVQSDLKEQIARLVNKNFVQKTPYTSLAHLPRYLTAMVLRLEKLKNDPARDAKLMQQARAEEQRWLREYQARKGSADERLNELRWLLEELRVSFFAQELRTPQPISVKRIEKVWQQLNL